jgi:predicted protein tyrosine phosphatase
MSKLPHPNSYLVRPGFIAGEYPGAADPAHAADRIAAHLDAGVTSFIDLTAPGELEPYNGLLPPGVRHTRLTIADMSVPHESAQMRTILDTIDAELAAGRTVYLHCWGGIGRTGTVVGCWFVRHGLDGDAALAAVMERYATVEKAARRPRSPETSAQEQYVRSWQETH